MDTQDPPGQGATRSNALSAPPASRDSTDSPLSVLSDAQTEPRLRRHFLQNLVHELSTPLTPLVGYLKLFQTRSLGELSPLQSKCLTGMSRATNRLQRMLDDLSYLLQMESGILRIEPTPVTVGTIVQTALTEGLDQAAEAKIEILVALGDVGSVELYGDESLLSAAVARLVSNGLKFNSPGGKLYIRGGLSDDGHSFRLELFDSGVGIKAADLGRVFDPFFQADHGATRRFEGAGLGLSLVQWIVRLHDGTIRLESPPSEQPSGHFFRGVRAIVELPLYHAT